MKKRVRKQELPTYVVELGKRIKNIREGKKMTITDLAYNCELDSQNLRKYENGKQEMKISTLKRIAEGLNISPSKLLDF